MKMESSFFKLNPQHTQIPTGEVLFEELDNLSTFNFEVVKRKKNDLKINIINRNRDKQQSELW